MATTPTSIIKRLMGTEAFPDALNFGGVAQTFAAGTTFGGVVVPGSSAPVSVAAATTTLTLTAALHAGVTVLVQPTGGLIITPPAATGTGNIYTIIVAATVSGGSLTVDFKAANASDLLNGTGMQFKAGTGASFYSCGTNTNLITLNGTTTGGVIGDVIIWQDVASHQNVLLQFWTQATSTVATPFSNH